MEGQTVRVDVIGNPITLVITKVAPKGIAIITDETDIEIKEEPNKPEYGMRDVSNIHYEDIVVLGRVLQIVCEKSEFSLRHPEIFVRLGIQPPNGLLLYGPPVTGKTLIANAVANEVDPYFIPISGPEIISEIYSASEGKLLEVL